MSKPVPIEQESTDLIKDVQSYLITKYREALKSGDKSFANSCLLSTRLLSATNPNISDEDLLNKSDGDVTEAAKLFSSIFKRLFSVGGSAQDNVPNDVMVVTNQMKEEMRLILTELKIHALKLKSSPDTLNPTSLRKAPPSSSPRSRMSSEDRSVMSRESLLKLDSHLISHKKSFFYQELFDNLAPDTRQELIDYSIENCDSPFERCRLMMLGITLSNDLVASYGPKLISNLIELSDPTKIDKTASGNEKASQRSSRATSMCQYAKSMLVLDAIPLVFSLVESRELELDVDKLINFTFRFYAEFCLNSACNEFELEELHESVRKSIASIDPLKSNSLEDHLEERVNLALNLLFDKYLNEFSNDTQTVAAFKKVRDMIADTSSMNSFPPLFQSLQELGLDVELSNDVLFASSKEVDQKPAIATPPPKSRGRPKKSQTSVIVSPDDGLRRHLVSAARKTAFLFLSQAQVFFMQSSQYLKLTRCLLPIDTKNPLALSVKAQYTKSQRKTRHTLAEGASPAKKHKAENQEHDEGVGMNLDYILSSPNVQEARLRASYTKLKNETKDFLDKSNSWFDLANCIKSDSPATENIYKLWERFTNESPNIADMRWIKRIEADRLISSGTYNKAVEILKSFIANGTKEQFIKRETADERVLTVPTSTAASSPTSDVALLRATTQLAYCYLQMEDSEHFLKTISDLLSKIKQTGLPVSSEDSLHDIVFDCLDKHDNSAHTNIDASLVNFEYPLMTVPSLINYCVHILMDILKYFSIYSTANQDLAIGHTIVLSQASWMRFSALYDTCIDWICANKPKSTTPQSISALTKFTYHDFFYFVQDPNILEDFMALLNHGYTLDIKSSQNVAALSSGSQTGVAGSAATRSSGASTRSGKAITTRGVNKSFKEELKVALVAQMKHSCAPVPLELLLEFIQTHLIPFLLTETETKSTKTR